MSMRSNLLSVFLAAAGLSFAGASTAEAALYAEIDIGPSTQRVEPGFVGLPSAPAAGTNATNYATNNLLSLTGDPFTIALSNVNAAGVATGNIDWRDRGDDPTPTTLSMLGEDFIKNNSGIVRVTLGSLPAGEWTVTSWHIDTDATQSNLIDVVVDTGSGFSSVLATGNAGFDLDINGANFNETSIGATAASFTFTSNGINDVIILFNGTRATDDETPLNGLRLEVIIPIPEPATASLGMLGLAGLAMRRRRLA